MNKVIMHIIIVFSLVTSQFTILGLPQSSDVINNLGYFDLINDAFDLTNEELDLLGENKFIVLNRLGTDDILDAYKYYWEEDLPIFITTDTMLQVWHLIFDELLEKTEENFLFPMLKSLSISMGDEIKTEMDVFSGDLATNDTLVYFAVANRLVNNTIDLPQNIADTSEQIFDAIMNEITIFQAVAEFQTNMSSRFIDDFSQYKPRGHYTSSESLMTYFRLFKWLSRIPFFFDSYCGEDFLKRSPNDMIKSTIQLTWILKNTFFEWEDLNINGLELWKCLKGFLDILVGETYGISPLDIDDVCMSLKMSDNWHFNDISSEDIINIQTSILSDDSISAPKDFFIIDGLAACTYSPKTFVFFGERLTLDTYALNHLVFPYVRGRLLPNGLDFAVTCLRSDRANDLLSSNYQSQLDNVTEELNNWPNEEKQTIYWKWIDSLSKLVVPQPESDEISVLYLPKFMKKGPWLDEKLTTVLGSWTQLKHDTILYIKQGLTSIICSTPEGYVEPYPQFYDSLGELCETLKDSYLEFNSLGLDFTDYYESRGWYQVFDSFIYAVDMLKLISNHELQATELSKVEKEFINTTYSEYHPGGCAPTTVRGWLIQILQGIDGGFVLLNEEPYSRVSLTADIHTDLNSGGVLQLATGLFEHIIVVVPGFNGNEILAVGPVFSYYEFITTMDNRMTDDDWRGIIYSRFDEGNYNYNYSLFPRGFWAENYMISTEMPISMLFHDSTSFNTPSWFSSGQLIDISSPYLSSVQIPYTTYDYPDYDPFNSTYAYPDYDPTNSDFNFFVTMGAATVGTAMVIFIFIRKKKVNTRRKQIL